ncbi:UDP-GlcNAc--UDP-phosphate GlcNAc-1-phosphate transferase [Polaribacter sp. WD7]|uniref:MraY family glycosyltransferase n=1 Tax=Polaribacter sp. WD7 TaxID=2269061 RepID=UPI000DF416B9|nr:glycosyltransferase family 4 protein [Polaribacter sp. WD7]RCS27689.1 UDP-GlcNAc--UDP-phosphate GlcNAc-1-phosphate transferase [Polaribacter sp. WD7]
MEKFLLVLIILIAASFIYLKLAIRFKIVDKPNQRSSHTKITVRGGGIIFPIAIVLFFVFNQFQYPYFVAGVLLISLVSFLDDIYTLSSKIRFPFQILAIALVLVELEVSLEFWFFFYVAWGVGVLNMFNFMDGINGITGLYSLSSLFGFYLINTEVDLVNDNLILYAALSLIVFGFYNFRKKALFFAGDIGSIAIGILIFFLGMLFAIKLSYPFVLMCIMVYGADAGMTLLYRKFYTKESVLDPHRHHIYQKLVDVYKISHLKVSALYAILQVVISYIAFKTYKFSMVNQSYVFLGIVLCLILSYVFLFKKIETKKQILNN